MMSKCLVFKKASRPFGPSYASNNYSIIIYIVNSDSFCIIEHDQKCHADALKPILTLILPSLKTNLPACKHRVCNQNEYTKTKEQI